MNKLFFNLLILIFILLKSSIAYTVENNSIFILAKVNNSIITNIDIIKEAKYLRALNPDLKKMNSNEIIKVAKNSMIREKIKENEILKYLELNLNDPAVSSAIKRFYSRLELNSESEFENYLSEFDLTLKFVKKKINIETGWNKLIYLKYNDLVEIDEKKIKEQVKKNIINNKQNLYLVSEILFNDISKTKISEKHKLIVQSITDIGFKNTAIKFSISDTKKFGGEVGWIEENQISTVFKNILSNLEIEQFSEPINVPGGKLILMLNDKKIENIELNYENEFKKLILFEKDRKLNQFSYIYFNKVMKAAKIETE